MESPILDRNAALERIGGDEELYQEVLSIFLDDTPVQIGVLNQALRSLDRVLGERQAHSLKSAAANIGAEAMRDACLKTEKAFAKSDPTVLAALVKKIEFEFSALRQHLELNQ